jgi:deoxyribodipyrimidine photolyase-related protein
MKAWLILGNQLFDPKILQSHESGVQLCFMREDFELCTHFKYHKHKIHFFLSAMRKYKQELESFGYKVVYEKLSKENVNFENALEKFIKKNKISELYCFEIEDKFFEIRIKELVKKLKLRLVELASPMFLSTKSDFREYLKNTKRPFMKNFYEQQRKNFKILVDEKLKPIGGKWSFDTENRKALAKNYKSLPLPIYKQDKIDKEIAELVEQDFPLHPGNVENIWLPTNRKLAQEWLISFLEDRLFEFGPYEDAMSQRYPFLNHSVLTPFLNTGLLTPDEVIEKTLSVAQKKKVPMNSLEGFVRQVIGWREFIRGIYQNFSEEQENLNFWNHQRKLNDSWYKAETKIPPLDDVINKVMKFGYAHHIERLMVVGSLMLLLEVHPFEAHRWFMEMFIDSSDWVMGPNV